jgi:hypothetical protein
VIARLAKYADEELLQDVIIYRIAKSGLATMREMQTILSLDDIQKMNAFLSMESIIESEVQKVLIPKA